MTTTVTTANLDFAKRLPQHREYLDHLTKQLTHPGDMLLVQEAKKIRLEALLPHGWHTMQRVATSSTRGSAVSWYGPVRIRGARIRLGSLPTNGLRWARMEVRHLAIVDLADSPLTVISAHYPPERYKFLWPQMDRRLARIIRRKLRAHRQVLVGMDGNTHLAAIANRLLTRGVKLHVASDGRIDGFLYTPGLQVSDVQVDHYGIEHGLTDHPSVTITVQEP